MPDTQTPQCTHGVPATYVTVVDETRKTPFDEYGDIEGPTNIDHLGAMAIICDQEAGDHADEPGRFTLGFIHTDGCRTEQRDRAQ